MDPTEPLTLPVTRDEPRKPPIPLVAALAPVGAGVVLWLVTGSLLALCFAAFGPLMMLASFIDGLRQRRRDGRRAAAEADRDWQRATEQLDARHRFERERLWRRHPGLRACLAGPLLVAESLSAQSRVVIGAGTVASTVRISGGDGDRAAQFRERAAELTGAPVSVELGDGIAVRGPAPIAAAVARALVVHLCARFAVGRLTLVGEGVAALGLAALPHAQSGEGFRIAVTAGSREHVRSDALICVIGDDSPPDEVSTVIDAVEPGRALVQTAAGTSAVSADVLSAAQLAVIARAWAAQSGATGIPATVLFDELSTPEPEPAGLAVAIGRGTSGQAVLDLVADGPHAIVTGMTGSGKSELLITWVTALAAAYPSSAVTFVLADFKGGAAFAPLQALPHVAAVITDLDTEGASRGVASLRAELRRREEVLAAVGARDISTAGVALARLVIVVDEFAALLHEHPDLAEVFTDIAARGRALGMHLILGTQRAGGVIRDALAANCPLRVSLRLTDAGDSRMLLGTDEAARLPGDPASRGLAMVRRPRDDAPTRIRVGLTRPDHIDQVRAARHSESPARSPWLPPLPLRITAAELPQRRHAAVLGLSDEPDRQRQEAVYLRWGTDRGFSVIGGPRSGKSSLVALLAKQQPDAVHVGPDPEQAWDAVTALAAGERAPRLLVCDDLDALATRFPAEYAAVFADALEQAVRHVGASQGAVVVTASRVTSLVSRIADLLPQRALLALPTRADHLAAGGSADTYLPRRPPGRAHLGGREVQIAESPAGQPPVTRAAARRWEPGPLTAVVAPHPVRLIEHLRAEHPHADVRRADEEVPGSSADGSAVIIVGDGEHWQRQWGRWQQIRANGDIVIVAECATELRTLAGTRELPPFARMHAGRAWLLSAGVPPVRVGLGRTALSP